MGVAGGTGGGAGNAADTRPPLRLVAWIGTLTAAAVASAAFATWVRAPAPTPSWPGVLLLAVALVGAGRLNVDFRHHGTVDSLDLFEAALTPAVFFLPAPDAVLLAAAGKALSQLWMRKPPVKAAFNVAQWAASAGAAALVFAALRSAGADPLRDLPALGAGMVSAAAVNLMALIVLFRLLGAAGAAGPSLLRLGYLTRTLALTMMNIVTGMLVVLAAASTAPAAVCLVLGPLLLAYWAGRGYTREYTDSQRMAALQRATHALAAAGDPRDGLAGYLTEVVSCFDAGAADAVLIRAAGLDVHRIWSASAQPLPSSQAVQAARPEPATEAGSYQRWTTTVQDSALFRALLSGQLPALVTGHRGGPDAELLRAAGWCDCLAVPLPVDGELAGVLCVYDRTGSVDFDASDLLILETLGRELTAALQRASLLDAVLDERSMLARIVNGTTDGIAALGADGTVLTWNPAFTALSGYSAAEMVGSSGLDRLDVRDATGRRVAIGRWATTAGPLPADVVIRTSAGPVRCLSCSYARATDPSRPTLLVVIARDVTELRRHQSLLASEAHVLELIAGETSLKASLHAVASMIRQESDSACSAILLAATWEPLRLVTAAAVPAHLAPLLLAGAKTVPAERWAESARTLEPVVFLAPAPEIGPPEAAQAVPNGLRCWGMPIPPDADAYPAGVLAAAFSPERRPTDTDRIVLRTAARLASIAVSRHEARRELRYQVSHDPLTGLPNRSLFLAHCVAALERAAREDRLIVVMFLDLDHFQFVNDSLGHDAGNRILVAVADRLRTAVRPEDTVARFGGDEFTILCQRIRGQEHARVVAERVRQIFATSFTLQDQEVFATASIGIALGKGRDLADKLVENADAAMYRAKDRGGNRFEFFDTAMRRNAQLRLGTYVALRNAVDRGEFTVLYQPIISLHNRRLVGVEALVRWQHPTDGQLLPVSFIELAEETGLILPIGAQVLHESLRQLQRWQHRLPIYRRLRMNVNLSARQFTQPDLVQMIELTLHDTRTAPEELSLEITESVLVSETQSVQTAISQLKTLGVGLTIDDFGTGHSSLTNLRRLPVDQLKVDRSFVAGMSKSEEDASIVSAVISLGHDLGLTVIAEGIETADQLHRLEQLGCDEAQGYYLGEPLTADRVMELAQSGSRPEAPRDAE